MALSRLQQCVEHYWYSKPGPLWLLYPFELLYQFISASKKKLNQKRLKKQPPLPVPVLVVGNISVGGTGKTPALISLVSYLQQKGFNPGVVSRGYGRVESDCIFLSEDSQSHQVGEEPLLIYNETRCPVCVFSDRHKAAEHLLRQAPECNLILADDGLQHYKLKRDFELALVDGDRLFGNQHLLPLGPLREAVSRLNEVDWLLVNYRSSNCGEVPALLERKNCFKTGLEIRGLFRVIDNQEVKHDELRASANPVSALTAIGNPNAFFESLRSLGVSIVEHRFVDHYRWQVNEVSQFSGKILICTSKDGVKLKELARNHRQLDASQWYQLGVELSLPETLKESVLNALTNWKTES